MSGTFYQLLALSKDPTGVFFPSSLQESQGPLGQELFSEGSGSDCESVPSFL